MNAGDVRDHVVRVDVEPLLEDRRVDGAEVGARLEVPLRVEPARDARVRADLLARQLRADQEADAAAAVIGPGRGVLGAAAAELRPHVHEHAVGDAARLEVALEREQRAPTRGRGRG